MLGHRNSHQDERFGRYGNRDYRHHGGSNAYAYRSIGGSGSDDFYARATTQTGSSKKFLLYSLSALVVFAALFALFEEEGGSGGGASSRNAVDAEAIAACAEVEIEGAEGQQLTLERHDDEQSHGDVCRSVSTGAFGCPKGCSVSAGKPPWCQKRGTTKPCRVKRSGEGALIYRCDPQGGERGVCVKVGESKGQKGGVGKYKDATCDNQCQYESLPGSGGDASGPGGGLFGNLFGSSSITQRNEFKCQSDWDCSLAGVCDAETGECVCDPWASGKDCSYLKFQPVDPTKIGYLHNEHTSWGGSVQMGTKDGMFHMFVSEIVCDANDLDQTRCGLAKWQTNSRVAHCVSGTVDGPYTRLSTVLPEEHHNPTVAVSPVDGSWNLYSIKKFDGPIEVVTSTDEGYTWSDPTIVSKFQNPAPFLHEDGSMTMFYRDDGGNLPPPTCSDEYVATQHCPSKDTPCENKKGKPVFGHTAEDPIVFRDHRGNFHMLMNAMPFLCVPKVRQGGHSWSSDGINWSEPRVGAFEANVELADGKTLACERRERPQMLLDPSSGMPLALVSAVTGCPKGAFPGYKGGDDSFTIVQLMAQ